MDKNRFGQETFCPAWSKTLKVRFGFFNPDSKKRTKFPFKASSSSLHLTYRKSSFFSAVSNLTLKSLQWGIKVASDKKAPLARSELKFKLPGNQLQDPSHFNKKSADDTHTSNSKITENSCSLQLLSHHPTHKASTWWISRGDIRLQRFAKWRGQIFRKFLVCQP